MLIKYVAFGVFTIFKQRCLSVCSKRMFNSTFGLARLGNWPTQRLVKDRKATSRISCLSTRTSTPPVKPNSPYRIQHPFPWLIGEIWKINHSEIGIRSLNWDNIKLIHSWILFNFHFILFTHYFKTDNF